MSPRAVALSEPPLPLFVGQPVPAHPSYIKDHRQRLRARFRNGGADAVPDYELLELVLFRALPRRDVKPIARALLDAFDDFAHVVAATEARLKTVDGVGDAVVTELKIVAAAATRMARGQIIDRPVLSSWTTLLQYCQTAFAHLATEQVRVLFLDRKNRLIADECQGEGTVDHVPVYPREVLKRALELGASALILVHNHPSGDPTPSESDIGMTREIVRAAELFRIPVHDHLVIGKSTEFSFRENGLL